MRAQRPCTHDPMHGKGSSTEGRNGLLDPLVVPLLQCANLGGNEIGNPNKHRCDAGPPGT